MVSPLYIMLLPFDFNSSIMNFSIDNLSFFVGKESNWIELLEFGFGEPVFQRVQIRTGEIDLVKELFFSYKLVGFFDLSLDIITLFHQFWFCFVKSWQPIFN